MPKIEINRERCKGCGLCVLYCPKSCIKQGASVNGKGVFPVMFADKSKACTGCSFCAIICPDTCIEVYK
ncbi:MAG: 4Fe-4S binding protein [Candidatus Omnitrophica bacterium]|nr:4Fe-4S binding protein [Candidatus Omnitrophota bacterium]